MFSSRQRPARPAAFSATPLSRLLCGILLVLLLVDPPAWIVRAESQNGSLPALEDRVTALEGTLGDCI